MSGSGTGGERRRRQEQQGPGGAAREGQQPQANVFETHGNELLLQYAKDAKNELGAVQGVNGSSPVLAAAEQQMKKDMEQNEDLDAADAARSALRGEAIAAREEIVLMLQQLMSNPAELATIASAGSRGGVAVQIIEYLAEYMSDDDLDALAAYDHEDMTYRMIIASDAYVECGDLSAQALKMGGFSTVLWQLTVDTLKQTTPGSIAKKEEEEDGPDWMKKPIFNMIQWIRMARTVGIV